IVAGFALINAGLTALVFNTGGNLQQYMGAVLLGVGALVAWLCVAALHYSDGPDKRLSQGVAALDSVALVFTVIHFAFLVWVFGQISTLQSAEREYKAAAEAFNAKAEKVSTDNVAIAQAARAVAQEQTKKARLDNDSIYQARKAAEAGAPLPRQRRPGSTEASGSGGAGLATSVIELERPVKPQESSAAYLVRWDAYIRLANLAELLLACATLIVIRNRSAMTNSPVGIPDIFPAKVYRSPVPAPVANFTTKKEPGKNHASSKFSAEGLNKLRAALSDISFGLHKRSFKCKVKNDCVWIFLMRARSGTQETISSTRATLQILNDAQETPRDKFARRLEEFLKARGFEV